MRNLEDLGKPTSIHAGSIHCGAWTIWSGCGAVHIPVLSQYVCFCEVPTTKRSKSAQNGVLELRSQIAAAIKNGMRMRMRKESQRGLRELSIPSDHSVQKFKQTCESNRIVCMHAHTHACMYTNMYMDGWMGAAGERIYCVRKYPGPCTPAWLWFGIQLAGPPASAPPPVSSFAQTLCDLT
jgi:hypothetical protein